jgi:hypothetical protein
VKLTGDNQSATVGAILPQPFVVQVRNPDGLPVDSVPVTFTLQFAQGDSAKLAADPSQLATGGRQVVVFTDAGGFARAFLRLGTAAGGHTVSANALIAWPGADIPDADIHRQRPAECWAAQLVIISGDDQKADRYGVRRGPRSEPIRTRSSCWCSTRSNGAGGGGPVAGLGRRGSLFAYDLQRPGLR